MKEEINYDALKEMFDKLKQPDPKGLILLPSLLNLEGFDVIEMPANEIRLMLIKMRNKDKCKEFISYEWMPGHRSPNCKNCGKEFWEHRI